LRELMKMWWELETWLGLVFQRKKDWVRGGSLVAWRKEVVINLETLNSNSVCSCGKLCERAWIFK
jgi:hypothetical protein